MAVLMGMTMIVSMKLITVPSRQNGDVTFE
jgi:hypothetical protein